MALCSSAVRQKHPKCVLQKARSRPYQNIPTPSATGLHEAELNTRARSVFFIMGGDGDLVVVNETWVLYGDGWGGCWEMVDVEGYAGCCRGAAGDS